MSNEPPNRPHPNPLPEGKGTRPRPKPRLGGRGTFKRVLDQNIRAWNGPIGMSIAPVTDPSIKLPRLGISIGRSVGNAVKRNRIKRILREAFRASRDQWGLAVDVVILVKPHETMPLAKYVEAIENLRSRVLRKRQAKATENIG